MKKYIAITGAIAAGIIAGELLANYALAPLLRRLGVATTGEV